MRKPVFTPTIFVLAAVSCFGSRLVYSQTLVTAQRVPFTVVKSTSVEEDGVFLTATYAFRADGSEVVFPAKPGDPYPPHRSVIDVPSRMMYSIDPASKTFHAERMTLRHLRKQTTFYKRCEDIYGAPNATVSCSPTDESVLGHRLFRVLSTTSLNDGTRFESEYWAAPDLNFYPLAEKKSLSGDFRNENLALSVTVGEPDPAWFEVPVGYQQVQLLSEFVVRADAARGRKVSADSESMRALDESMRRRQAEVEAGR
ncbi:MAG: hypothetical protein ACRD8O_22840 [Bryobacteraceae bacterium]